MIYFQSVFKHHRMIVPGLLLAFVLVLGCSTHKAENMAEPAGSGSSAQTADSGAAVPSVTAVKTGLASDRVMVEVRGTGPLTYTSIKQAFPFGIAVYLPETAIGAGVVPEKVDDPDVSGIRIGYADQAQTTAKMEIFLNKDLPYTVQEGENSFTVFIDRETGNSASQTLIGDSEDTRAVAASQAAAPPAESDAVEPDVTEPDVTEPLQPLTDEIPPSVSGVPAQVTHIEFDTAPTGRSDIRINTSQPVRYETRQIGQNQIRLVLFNTRVPKAHQRPLLTRYFESAVEKVLPSQASGQAAETHIDVLIREQVPYQLARTRQGIQMVFEPSSVQPPQFDKAKVGAGEQAPSSDVATPAQETSQAGQDDMFSDQPPVYTGEKIKLDFFDTDIKNVFRIFRSVSGLNFAVDDDVRGKVTLSLEEPVPWDQVMDLVLKMNGLGKIMEGNVIRISTLKTIAAEEKALQDTIAAKKRSIEQKESLEPLVTEYIPINYSDANADIKPHVEQILTPDRGRLSVDTRTNMIIITDTQAKIDQANDLIYRLDTVTPQIMIEARVVEVTKEFSRNLGMQWNLSNVGETVSSFANDYDISINQSGTLGSSGEFTFLRLLGTSSALNAKLAASEELGEVRIVSSPRILTLDNKQAMIKQGLEYAYLERDDSGGSSVSFKDIDLLLEVTPHVTPDKRVSMTVHLTKNDVDSLTSTGVPTLATNEAKTELLVNNNETVVIGGVVKTRKSDKDTGFPFITGIPVLNYLFGTNVKSDDRNELLIFLTPSIVQLEQKRHIGSTVAN